MKSIYLFKSCRFQLFFLSILLIPVRFSAQVVQSFSYTGSVQTFVVPSCVSTISVDARGGAGGDGGKFSSSTSSITTGGNGGRVMATLSVTPGQTLYIYVGGAGISGTHTAGGSGGFNGGGLGRNSTGSGGGGGGGGASDVRQGGNALIDRVIVAAGGGGGGGSGSASSNGGNGGDGGGLTGLAGANGNSPYGIGGGGGTTSAGGPFGGTMTGATAGVLGMGGDGSGVLSNGSGGGGGGGYYGGGGGGTNLCSGCTTSSGGGGGGSSYTGPGTASAVHAPGFQSGAGSVTFSYNFDGGVVTTSPTSTAICNGTSLTLTAAGVLSYTWSTNANSNTVVVSPNTSATYTVQGTNSNSCISVAVITVTVNPGLPTLTVTQSSATVCPGQSVTLTAGGATTYSWTGGISNGVAFSPATTATYVVTGENACGTVSATSSITVTPLPVFVSSTHTSVCTNKSATLTAVSSGTSYTWQPVNITGGNTVILVSPTVNTVYTVTASDGTCAGTATVALISDPVPAIGVAASSTMICPGDPSTLTATGGQTYTWTPGGASSTMIVVSPAASILYMVAGSNSFGCENTAAIPLITKTQPTLSILTAANPVCAGAAANLTVNGADMYAWNGGPNSNTYQVMPLQTATYVVSGTLTSSGCVSTASIVLGVFSPQMNIAGDTVICIGQSTSLLASVPGVTSFTWNLNNFPFNPLVATPTITTVYVASTTSYSGALACPVTGSVLVLVHPRPEMNAVSIPSVVCRNETAILNASGASTYTWSHSSGIVGTSATITLNPKTAALSVYTVTGSNAFGCVSTKTLLLLVQTCTGLDEQGGADKGIEVYPNPSIGDITVASRTAAELLLINETGQMVRTLRLNEENGYKIFITGLKAGLYFITGNAGTYVISTKKIVIAR